MNTNTEHLHEDQENSQLHRKSWKLIFFRRHCCFSLHLTTTTCHFWSALAQLTAKVLVPTLMAHSNTTEISSCFLSKNTASETKRKALKLESNTCLHHGSQEVHTATLRCEQRGLQVLLTWVCRQPQCYLIFIFQMAGWTTFKKEEEKKEKNSSQPKPKFDSLQLPETGNLHRQRNFTTVLPHCPRYKCRNLRKDFCISKLNTPWGLFHPGKCTYAAEVLFSTPSNKGKKKKKGKNRHFIRFIYRMTLLLVAHWRPC